jgi:hypothetical protein
MSGNIIDPSMSAGKASDLMAHQNGVRCNIAGEMEVKITHKDGSQDKLHDICSTHDGRREYLDRLNEFSEELIKLNSPIKTNRALRASAGKDFDASASQPHALAELNTNKRRKLDFMSPSQLETGINKMNTAKTNGDLFLPQSEDDLRLKKAKSVRKEDCISLLTRYGYTDGRSEEELKALNKAKKTAATDVTLEDLVVALLVEHPNAADKNSENQYVALL